MEKFAINLDENNRILRSTYEQFADDESIIVDSLPEGNITDYIYHEADNSYEYDPIPVEPIIIKEPITNLMMKVLADQEERLCLIELGI